MSLKEVVLLIILQNFRYSNGDFMAPEITLEAYKPKGLRASIPAQEGIQMFAFHANVNKEISQVDPGEMGGDLTQPTGNNVWSFFNDNITLKVGDTIHYWTFIQFEKLGYRKDAQQWVVPELLKAQESVCETSLSLVAKKALVCKNSMVLDAKFKEQTIDKSLWLVEQFIPYLSEDFEFVSYQNKPDVCYVQNNKLYIKPKPAQTDNEVRGELDLRDSCTRTNVNECYFKQQLTFILPPVTSGRIVSVLNFRYGKVEIKAKLPAGDWMYPQIYLEQVSDSNKKLWIAYSRGNVHLNASNGEDIGGHLLFGGPVLDPTEPGRSTYLRSTKNANPFSSEAHTYTVIWTKDLISLLLDGTEYGRIEKDEMSTINFAENDMVRLVLAVGVGGVNDFPDDFRTGNADDIKPWRNRGRSQVKNFFNERAKWLKTWTGDKSALQIEYVKVTAL